MNVIEEHLIPQITDPLGRYWEQPDRNEIKISNDIALMNKDTFDKLKDYTRSTPTGTYFGKMWKGKFGNKWYLCWYYAHPDPNKISIGSRQIMFYNGKPD